MLRKITRPVTSKQQTIVNDHQWIPPEKPTKNSSFFFNSHTFFKGFFNNKIDLNPMISPISILDKNPFSIVANFLVFDNKNTKISSNNFTKNNKKNHCWEQSSNKKGIVLALIDENIETHKKTKQKYVVFGPQLRINLKKSSVFPCFSPESPREFGIKTPRNNLFDLGSKNGVICVNESVLMGEIDEKSEDYTCVISHGPNPKTTHIFGNCIVEKCCGKIVGVTCFSPKVNNGNLPTFGNLSPSQSQDGLLSFCFNCKKKLGDGKDIYMYRGEKAFCSEECRSQDMFFDEVEK